MIKLGILGTANPDFREQYVPALQRLGKKIRIVGIYDAVWKRAEQAAAAWEAPICGSFQKLIHRSDVQAVLVLSPGWYGLLPVALALQAGKPVFCTQAVWNSVPCSSFLRDLSQQASSAAVVESRYRYWPSSLRARELQATQLGKPLQLTCYLQPEFLTHTAENWQYWAEWLDWGRFLLQRSHLQEIEPAQSGLAASAAAAGTAQQLVHFSRERDGQVFEPIPVHFVSPPPRELPEVPDDSCPPAPLLKMECEGGWLEILSSTVLNWSAHAEKSPASHTEYLHSEQCGFTRQLDHFCRRVAGGLIPIHEIVDVLWSQQAAHQLLKLT